MDDREEYEKRVGTTVRDKWKIERLLGAGGMAAVYVGRHHLRGPEALKILHPQMARNKDLRDRFVQEAKVLSGFSHPGVVKVLDIDKTEDGAPFMAMELLEGESLTDRARRLDGVALGEMLGYVDELLDVLVAAHEAGIVHRDIKLDNLFIQKSGSLKVLDFGVARLRDSANKAVQTRAGAMLGTLPYMPPEQVRGQEIDARADLFAVGATMFRLVAKKRIHDASTESEMLVKMATLPAPPLASVAKKAPASLCLVVDRALAFHRDERYPSAKQMQDDVRALRRGDPPAYATARLAGALPGDPEPSLRSPEPPSGGRVSYGDVPTVVPGAKGAAHAATVALIAAEDTGGGACVQAAQSEPPSAERAQQPKTTTAGGTLLMSQPSFSVPGLPSVDASPGPLSASASSAPPVTARPSPHNGNPAAPSPRAEMGPAIATGIHTTMGTGQPLPQPASGGRMMQVLVVVLFAGIAALAMIAGGLWWYFRNESSGGEANPAAVPAISATPASGEPPKSPPRNDVPAAATTPSQELSGKKKPGQWRVKQH